MVLMDALCAFGTCVWMPASERVAEVLLAFWHGMFLMETLLGWRLLVCDMLCLYGVVLVLCSMQPGVS